jgi:hypothetical protein
VNIQQYVTTGRITGHVITYTMPYNINTTFKDKHLINRIALYIFMRNLWVYLCLLIVEAIIDAWIPHRPTIHATNNAI